MAFVIMALGAAAAVLLWKHIKLRREITRLTAAMTSADFLNSNERLTVSGGNRTVRALVEAVNGQIDLFIRHTRGAERTEREIRQAIAHLSHDLRTPLTSLLGYLRLMNRDSLDEHNHRHLGVIESKAHILKILVEDLFDLSVLESGEYAYDPELLPVSGIIGDILADYANEIERMFGEPRLCLAENAMITGDKALLERAFRNIIQNALQHGRGPLDIKTEVSDACVCIRFQNSAKNPDAVDIDRVFDRFYRADVARPSDGYGLGLSIVKKIVEIMGGQIHATYTDRVFSLEIVFSLDSRPMH